MHMYKTFKDKSFPTPQRYALKATFVGDSYTVATAIIYLGDNRFHSTKILKENIHQQYCKSIYISFFSTQISESVAQR